MTTQPFVESDMTFGPYPNGHCFRIEQSAVYKKVQQRVKMADLLLLRARAGRPTQVWIVEAKKRAPRPQPQPRFDEYIGDIREQISNALSLSLAVWLKRHSSGDPNSPDPFEELPDPFKSSDLSKADFRLVLVVREHQESWLAPLQDALRKALQTTVKTWGLGANAVVVLNEDLARRQKLIREETKYPYGAV